MTTAFNSADASPASNGKMVTIADAAALCALVDAPPVQSGWIEIDQTCVDGFAEATGDEQWIHVDPERARRESPFGGPIAHGFLTLSLIPVLLQRTLAIQQRMGLNYGLNRVRFTLPVAVGSRVRAQLRAIEAREVEGGGVQVTWDVSVQAEGAAKPACVAEFITRHYF